MANNWRKIYAMKKQAETKLLKVKPNLKNESGIYILTRVDENGFRFAYLGQAKHLIDRLVSHLNGYSQRIDISLKKRGLYDESKRPYGWQLDVYYCDESILDEEEKCFIKSYADMGFQLYNKTSGSQSEGKSGIADGQSNKGYREGLKQGYENCLKDIREYFDKYLEFRTQPRKEAYKKTKKGELPRLKEIYIKKFNEFSELLKGEQDDLQESGNDTQTR